MSREIILRVRSHWAEESVMKRLCRIVCPSSFDQPIQQDHGYRWQLGRLNDWHAEDRRAAAREEGRPVCRGVVILPEGK